MRRQRPVELAGVERPGVVVGVLSATLVGVYGIGTVVVPVGPRSEHPVRDLDGELVVADIAKEPGVIQRQR